MSYTFTKLSDVPTTESLNSEDMVLVEQDGEIKRVSNNIFNMGGSSGGSGAVVFKGPFQYSDGIDDFCYALDQNDNVVSNRNLVDAFKQGVVVFDVGDPGDYFNFGDASQLHTTMLGFYLSFEGGTQVRASLNGAYSDIIFRPDGTIQRGDVV